MWKRYHIPDAFDDACTRQSAFGKPGNRFQIAIYCLRRATATYGISKDFHACRDGRRPDGKCGMIPVLGRPWRTRHIVNPREVNLNRLAILAAIALMALSSTAYAQERPVLASIVFQGDQFMKSLQAGMRSAAQENGAEILEINIDGDQTKETEAIDTYIARGVDAIVIAPVSATNSAAALKRAADAGIIVVTVNGGLEEPGIAKANFSTSNKDLGLSTGEAAAEFIRNELEGKADVAILAFKSLLPEQSGDRTGGFLEAAGMGTELNLVAEQDAWLPEKAVTVATDILTANPDLDVIYAANEGGTIGAMQAVRNAGKAGQVYVFGIDGSEQLARGLTSDDNVLQAVTAQAPFDMGAEGVKAALALLKGEAVQETVTVPSLLLSRTTPETIEAFVSNLNN